MPRRLPARWQPECIREFHAAARQRFDDGLALAGQGRRTGAIYMWGYSAEMAIKAAYFSLTMGEADPIEWNPHISGAIHHGRTVRMIHWPHHEAGHNVRAWAELLVAERATIPLLVYPAPIGLHIQTCGQRIGALWSATLRYHKNVAYLYEMTQVRLAAEWLMAHLHTL